EQELAESSCASAAALSHPFKAIAPHVARPISVRKPSLVRREHDVAGHGLVDGQRATHPLAHAAVEEVRLVPVDEHQEEIERKLLKRADVLFRTGRQMIEARLLEAVCLRTHT